MGAVQEQIRTDISILEYGIAGEKRIEYELKNSHIPMYVLHDLYLEHQGLTAQIDYLIITPKCSFVIECKNFYGTIEVNSKGEFTRTLYGKRYPRKEGMYSPITQNQRHLELMKSIKVGNEMINLINSFLGDMFSKTYIPVVVIANDKTVLNDRYAKKDIKEQIIKSDRLIDFMKEKNQKSGLTSLSDSEMRDIAEAWLSLDIERREDRLERYRKMEEKPEDTVSEQISAEKEQILCPLCGAPMVKRVARKGNNSGNEFYGCSDFPKCKGIVNIK